MRSGVISESFASAIRRAPDASFDIICEVALPTSASDDVEKAYESLDAHYQALAKAINDEIARTGKGAIRDPQRPAIAPYLFANLLGASISEIASTCDPLLVRISPNFLRARSGRSFQSQDLVSETLAEPLGSRVRAHPLAVQDVIIHLDVRGTRSTARAALVGELTAIQARLPSAVAFEPSSEAAHPYVFARMTGYAILALVDLDRNPLTAPRDIYRIWEDSKVQAFITDTIATVKVDAAHAAFGAFGKGIVWAVLDSGIDGTHPHFAHFQNLLCPRPLSHKDCRRVPAPLQADVTAASEPVGAAQSVPSAAGGVVVVAPAATTQPASQAEIDPTIGSALEDRFGHGSHVAGIIAGAMSTQWPAVSKTSPATQSAAPEAANTTAAGQTAVNQAPSAVVTTRNEAGVEEQQHLSLDMVSGMAPKCTLLSLRVLDDDGTGNVSSLIEAIDQIQQWNDFGRKLIVHGVNLSVGYPFEAEWFACGQSPLCIEVDQLVASGVVVVVAAGNAGYGYVETEGSGAIAHGIQMSITDPGNSDLAITVGSTHRTAPHRFGVSYFSSKGPTGDGRLKPDLLAPGERIISCASTQSRVTQTIIQKDGDPGTTLDPEGYTYKEDSGTSMAAPHVSGAIAAFLSIRREYIGRPREVKALFMSAATDLGRDRAYQGAGLVDLMRTIQSV